MRRLAATLLLGAGLSAAAAALVRATVPRAGTMTRLPGARPMRVIAAGPSLVPAGSASGTPTGDGHLALLIHGLGGQAENFARLTPLLADRHSLSVDRAGAGRSPAAPPGGASLPAQAARIAALIEARAAGPAVVVGHSLGGAVALQLAADRPDLVRGLVLIGALTQPYLPRLAAIGAGVSARPVLREAMARTVLVPAMLALSPWLIRLTFGPEAMPRGFLRWGGGLLAGQPRALSGALRDLDVVHAGIAALQPRLPGITMPAVILHGRQDRVLPLSQARHLAAVLPQARLCIVEGAGHMLPVTRPDICAAAIRAI